MKGIYLRCENCRKFTSTEKKSARKGGHIYCQCGENLSRKRQIYYRLKSGFYRAESDSLSDAYEEYLYAKGIGGSKISKKVKMGTLLDTYLSENKPSAREQYRWNLIFEYFKEIPLTAVTPFVIKDFCNTLKNPNRRKKLYTKEKYEMIQKYGHDKKVLSDNSLRYYLIKLRQFYNWCVNLNYVKEIPFDQDLYNLSKNKKSDFNPGILNIEESLKLLKAAKYSKNKELYLFILIGLSTGLRKSNITSIKLEWIDFEESLIIIPKEYTKGKRAIRVPLSQILLDEIQEHLNKHEITSGNLFSTKDFRTSYANALKLAGLPYIRIHDLRHSAATLLLRSSRNHYIVKELLSHSTIQVTEKYLHLIDDDLKQEATKHQENLLNGAND